jgi:hypothetical protein
VVGGGGYGYDGYPYGGGGGYEYGRGVSSRQRPEVEGMDMVECSSKQRSEVEGTNLEGMDMVEGTNLAGMDMEVVEREHRGMMLTKHWMDDGAEIHRQTHREREPAKSGY